MKAGIRGAALCAAVSVLLLVGASGAQAGTTVASSLTKTGTDAVTGATAISTGAVGTTGPGHAINWVLHYSNTTGAPASVNIKDRVGANQTFVPGSLRVPSGSGLAPEWSTNGGSSWVTSEPSSGVNAVGATGTVAPGGLGATGGFSAISTVANGSNGGGDGWDDIFYGGNVYNLHHDYITGASSTITLIDCHVVATGAECPGFDAGGLSGLDASSTAGTPFFSAAGQPLSSNFTTPTDNFEALDRSTGNLYFATTIAGTANFGIGCLDLANNTSCGFHQLGTGPAAIASSGPPGGSGYAAGGAVIGTRYYIIDRTGTIDCYDYASATTCGAYPAFGSGISQLNASTSEVQAWDGRYLFATFLKPTPFPGQFQVSCVDLSTGSTCSGYPAVLPRGTPGLLPVLNGSGGVAGACVVSMTNGGNTSVHTIGCRDLAGATISNPYPVPPASSPSWAGELEAAVVGAKVYWNLATDNLNAIPATYQYQCYDFAAGAPCAGFSSPAQTYTYQGTGDLRVYSIVADPYLPGCMGEYGDGGIVQFFDARTGQLGCPGSAGRVSIDPTAAYCDGQSGHVSGWNQVVVSGIPAADYQGATVTVLDSNGVPVPGFNGVSLSSGQQSLDISAIPVSGATASLSAVVRIPSPSTGLTPQVSITFKGDPAQICFKTSAGPTACSVSQSISNDATAVTTGSDGVADAPGGDRSGAATFVEAPDTRTASCKADLSISKRVSSSSVPPGGQVMYTLVVVNHGPDSATEATVSDAIPAGLTVSSVKPSQGTCSVSGSIECSLGTLASGGAAQVLVTANLASTATGSIENCATTSAFQADPTASNNSGCVSVSVAPPAPAPAQPGSDVKVVKHVNLGSTYPGHQLTYTLSVTNLGPATAGHVNVTDTASLALKVVKVHPTHGSCKAGPPITCSLGSLAAHKSITITVVAQAKQSGTELNTASVTSASGDVDPANNLSGARTALSPILKLAKTASTRTAKAGQTVRYRIKVTNPTDLPIANVTVCDGLPSGLLYTGSSPKARLTTGRYCWSIRRLAAGRSQTYTISVNVAPGRGGREVNRATATARAVRSASAAASVRVTPTAPVPCATASIARIRRGMGVAPVARIAC